VWPDIRPDIRPDIQPDKGGPHCFRVRRAGCDSAQAIGKWRDPGNYCRQMVDGGGKWSTVAPAGVTCVILEAKEVREMFLGTHAPRLDDKGRLVLPAKFREALAPGLVLTKGQERSIVVWPAAEFAAYAERLNEASRSDAKVRAYLRVLFSGAFDDQPDKQGRINIPPALREYAGLDRDVIVVGNNSTVEIWDAGAWESYLGSQEDGFSGLSEEVVPGVL